MKKFLLLICHISTVIFFSGQICWRVDSQNEFVGTNPNWNRMKQTNPQIPAVNVEKKHPVTSTGATSNASFRTISGFTNYSGTNGQGLNLDGFSDLFIDMGRVITSAPWERGTEWFNVHRTKSNAVQTFNVGDLVANPNWKNHQVLTKTRNITPLAPLNITDFVGITDISLQEQTGWIPTNPDSSTNVIVDDDANTFDFTLNPIYKSLSQYEYTLDSGFTWHTVRIKPIAVNNVGIKKGFVGVRVKDMNDNREGIPLWSNFDFTVSSPTFIPSVITVKVLLSGTPEWTAKLVPAGLKYNKNGRFGMTMDDRGKTVQDLAAYVTGGTSPANSQTYAGKTFTDGANVNGKNIKWTGSIASNAYASADTSLDAGGFAESYSMTWAQVNPLLTNGWNLLDHGAWHGILGGNAYVDNTLMNSAQNRNYSYRKLLEQGTEYVMRYGVVPTNDKDYHAAWEQLGYAGGSSQGTHDNYSHQYNANNVTTWLKDRSYKVHLRYFSDLRPTSEGADISQWIDAINGATASTSTTHYSTEIGMHNVNIDSVIRMMDYAAKQFKNNIWVCGLQEFSEYFETAQETNIKQRIDGDTLIVTLDQTFLNPEIRWRDMSLMLNSNTGIQSVFVTGADGFSYNTSTGLINIYKKKTNGYSAPPDAYHMEFTRGKIPLKQYDVYIDNNYDRLPEEMIDGDTSTRYDPKTSGSFIYNPYEFIVDLQDFGVVVDSVKIRVNSGGTYTTKVLMTRNDNEAEDSIGVFTQQATSKWLTFFPDTMNRYVSSRIILRTQDADGFGNEIRVYGMYMPYGLEQKYTHRKTPLKYEVGANSFWWNFTNNVTGLNVPTTFAILDSLQLHSIRNYADVWDYQNEDGSAWSFNPIQQGWREDQYAQHLKQRYPELIYFGVQQGQTRAIQATWKRHDSSQMMKAVITELQSLGYGYNLKASVYWTVGSGNNAVQGKCWITPLSGIGVESSSDSWQVIPTPDKWPMVLTWGIPNGHGYVVGDTLLFTTRYTSSLLVPYDGNWNRQKLQMWDTIARTAYVWAARKGKNPFASKFVPTPGNNDSTALGTADWLEQMNEPDKAWIGWNDYMNGSDLALAWSKGYDNNKVFSSSLGMKNADPAMKYSSSGLAVSNAAPMRGENYWSKKNRGNIPKTDIGVQPMTWKARTFGWVDHPYDIIQFHNYSYTGGTNQFAGTIQSGLPIELSGACTAVREYELFRNKYAPYASLDVGEWGYDRSQNSTMNAPYIDNHHAEVVRGAWSVRTLLYYNAHGIDYAQWYKLTGEHPGDDTSASIQFETMALMIDSLGDQQYVRLNKVGYMFAQMNEFGDYVYDSTLREDSIYCYRFKNDANYLYAVWSVESSPNQSKWKNEKAVFHERTGIYRLPFKKGIQVKILEPQNYGLRMKLQLEKVPTLGLTIRYGLMPTFVQVGKTVL